MTVELRPIDQPLPGRFATGGAGVGGVIKTRPEDFEVEELALYEPSDRGEHVYLRVEKSGVSHVELIAVLRRHFGVPHRAVGFAGMKDKHAVTRQTVSIRLPGVEPSGRPIDHDRIRVLWASRHTNKIRIGHLAGNRFSVRIRDVDPAAVVAARDRLAQLERGGIPNYFGAQRFGYRLANHALGRLVLKSDWGGLLAELLGTGGSAFPEYQRPRRELFDEARYEEAAALWTPADRNELAVIKTLASGASKRDAVRAAGKAVRRFWISAFQSAIFNRVLDRRLDAGALAALVEGDLAWKHDNGAVFAVTAEELARPELAGRVERLEVSPSGPLWGAGMTRAGSAVAVAEEEALAASGLGPADLGAVRGARRPLRVPIANTAIEAGGDEHGPYIRVAFDLPPGAYATVVLRELMKSEV